MADEFQNIGSGNWWDSSRNRFDSGGSPSSTALSSIGSFGWATEIVDMKARPSMDSGGSVAVSGSSNVFQHTQKLQAPHDSHDPNLQIMGLGLASQPMDWNQPLLRGGKGSESSSTFRSLLQVEDLSSNTSYHQQSDDQMASSSSVQINSRGFSLDRPHFSSDHGDSAVSCQGSSFQVDSGVYGSPSTMLQGVLLGGSENQVAQQSGGGGSFDNRSMNLLYPSNYGGSSGEAVLASWSKFPHFMRSSPPKHPPQPHTHTHTHTHDLHFSNNAPFWNASAAAPPNDVSSTFFSPLHAQFPTQSFDEKPKNSTEAGDLGTVGKKSSSEASSKRLRSETPSTLPAFKVRKEKMGDRITALQQLVSPFGKTDTASVLTEAIEYIKFLHEQVSVLSTPYMKSGAPIQQNQNSEKSKEPEGPKQDLRSRGLCLVPVSSTFPVTHESTVDFWTPTFGGTFR